MITHKHVFVFKNAIDKHGLHTRISRCSSRKLSYLLIVLMGHTMVFNVQ